MISEGHSQPRKSNIQKAIILVINVPKHLCLVYKCLIETLLHQRCKSGTSICAIFYGLVLIFELSQHAPAHHCCLLPKPRWTRRWPLYPGLSPSSLSSSRGWKSERVWTRGPRRQRDDEPSSADTAELWDAVNGCDRLKDLQCPAFYPFFYFHGPIF